MVDIEVIVAGYTREKQRGWEANATTTLITTKYKRIIVDPGMDRLALQDGLEKKALDPTDITDVFVTHFHIDHMLNISVFPNARLVDGSCIISGNGGIPHDGQPFGDGISILPTPGHAPDHAALAISKHKQVYCIVGDVIWYPVKSLKEALDLPDPYAYNKKLLKNSRTHVWQAADVIIPGHGPIFLKG